MQRVRRRRDLRHRSLESRNRVAEIVGRQGTGLRRRPGSAYAHSRESAETVQTPLRDLENPSGFMIEVVLDVQWERVESMPRVMAIQPFLSAGDLGCAGIQGYAVPDPKDVVLAGTLTVMDAYATLREQAMAAEAKGDVAGVRRICESALTTFPHAMELHEMLDDTYEGLSEHAAWLAVCRRALGAAKVLGVESIIGLDEDLEALSVDRRKERVGKLSQEFEAYWTERVRDVESLVGKPATPK